MVAVIMAGGRGRRLAGLPSYKNVPKPMVRVAGKPVLEHQAECLVKQSITRIIIAVGYRGEAIKDYFGDGSHMGAEISYLEEESPLGTAGVLYGLKDKIHETFLLLNGDIIFDIDFHKFRKEHERNCRSGGLVTILTHPNSHPYDSAVVIADEQAKVTGWLHKEERREWYQNRVNAGIHMCSPGLFPWLLEKGMLKGPVKLDLDREVLKPLMGAGKLFAYDSPEYAKDMGTVERLRQVEHDIAAGKVKARSLTVSRSAVFLDRDGTINKYVGYLRRPEEFQLLEGVGEAVGRLNRCDYLVIVVTNQPAVARGEVTLEQLRTIHNKMETLLGKEGAYVDAVYYCPHHPDGGFKGERPEYKAVCGCRKPKPGMIFEAAKRFHINLSESWMVGDTPTDMKAGENAGCHTAGVYGCQGERSFRDLLEFSMFLCRTG